MYPTAYGRLWHPGHGINFANGRPNEDAHPHVDMLRSLHITSRNPLQTAAATTNEDNYIHSEEDDPPFSTAPEYQPSSNTDNVYYPPLAGDDVVQAEADPIAVSQGSSDAVEPYLTNLDFKIPPDAFREAQSAPAGSPESFYSYTLYRGPPGEDGEKKVKVHYCRSKHTMEQVCQYFLKDDVLGFDLEWLPDSRKTDGPRKNVSLIQLANESRIALFHVALFPEKDELVSPTFVKIMGNANVRKVGVAIKGDCTRLRNHLGVDTKGIFELSHLYKLVRYSEERKYDLINKRLVPLAVIVQEHLGLPMYKEPDIRSSDWSRKIGLQQIMYSATDAYAGFQLYHVLDGKREALDPTPPRPQHAELNIPIRLADGVLIPTVGESTEDIDNDASKTTAGPSLYALRQARENMFIELDAESESIAESIQRAPSTSLPKLPQRDPRVLAADEELATYRTTTKSLRASGPAIRSYFVWRDNDDLDPEAISKILRQPPLQTMTVVTYILEAIRLEGLPFDKKRLREECLSRLPAEVLQGKGRYKTLMQEASEPDA
ncbi:3' -5' exonuclease helicase [Colletotrichum karsti]|uniref:3' -5' exonuclease helicase n=1 Tax=Colletotrichum karsti TaxID=1095194 RepID=A0A9P6LPN9_9PEZI|nr:3' -5' exonuclease helicase [Colletotrichum karsti]KAF9881145.1 3' -5' exonuclease helicase [Colletotrichum karsti]